MKSPYGSKFDGARWPWVLQEAWEDFYVLVDSEGRYVSDACVEGSGQEWRDIAHALRVREPEHYKRCAVSWDGETFSLCSPRNTVGGSAQMSGHAKADELADIIDVALGVAGKGAKP